MYYCKIKHSWEFSFYYYYEYVYFNTQSALEKFVGSYDQRMSEIVETGNAAFNNAGILTAC